MPNIQIQGLPYRKEGLADILQPAVDLFTKWKMELEPKLKQEALKTVIEQQKQAEALRHNQAAEGETGRHNLATEGAPVGLGSGMIRDPSAPGGVRQIGPWNVPAGGTAILPPAMGGMGSGGGGGMPPALSQSSGGAPPGMGMPGLQPQQGPPPALNTFTAPTAPKPPQDFNLGPGQRRYDANGNVIASAPMTPSQLHVPGPTTTGQVTVKDRWKSEDDRRMAATTSLQKAHDDYQLQFDSIEQRKDAITNGLKDGTTDWSKLTEGERKAMVTSLEAQQARLTKQYQNRARSAGWNEQGQWAAGGKKAAPKGGKTKKRFNAQTGQIETVAY
jgi:hypothetical protein